MRYTLLFVGVCSVSLFGSIMNCGMCHNNNYYPLDKYTPVQLEKKLYDLRQNGYGTMSSIAKKLTPQEIKQVSKKYGKK